MSIQEVVNSCYRIKESASGVQQRTAAAAEVLRNSAARLSATVNASKTGQGAVAEVQQAERALRDASLCLLSLGREIDGLVDHLTR